MGLLVKILALVLIILIFVIVFLTCSDSSGCLCQRIDKTMPAIDRAPYTVTTRTHIYYTLEVEALPDGAVRMNDWYERDGDTWVFHEEEIILPALLRPVIKRR